MSKDDAKIVASGLAALMGNNKFTLAQASDITEAFARIVSSVTKTADLEKRVKKLEASAKKSKKAEPLVRLAS